MAGVQREAPSFAPAAASHQAPAAIVSALLARFGDRRFITDIRIGTPPKDWYRSWIKHPPKNGLWAYIHSAELPTPRGMPGSDAGELAGWEMGLVGGALRDDFCAAGGRSLVGWSAGRDHQGRSDSLYPFAQRFPNPSPEAFRAQVARLAHRYGFHVVALRLLRPSGLAPLLIVQTSRPRGKFAGDVPAILNALDRGPPAVQSAPWRFEGFYFEARDSKGAFVETEDVLRGTDEGGQWAAAENLFPYPHG